MRQRARIVVRGVVQGVGFRPFVYGLATSLRLGGWVCNSSQGVILEVEGEGEVLERFLERLRRERPPLAQVQGLEAVPIKPRGEEGFRILESVSTGQQLALIPADVATCSDCAREVCDPSDRRYLYPFTNCTNCGPRFTIIRGIPYDRPQTTMTAFQMCRECQAEYHDPRDRRFHAQPNACSRCGPTVSLDGAVGAEAITRATRLLWEGKVVAVKGLGGFHLACDARNSGAVEQLRRSKGRSRKPFALMAKNLEEARRFCQVSLGEERLLVSQERPIVLLRMRPGCQISPLVAPGQRYHGVMLPYTPLHHLLLSHSPPCLVMTSGNLSEEPIAFKDEDALGRLGHLADHFLLHDREIHMGCDDSVMAWVGGEAVMLRRSRGYVPRPIQLAFSAPCLLATGGEQKNTFCITQGSSAILSQHIGDLEDVQTLQYYQRALRHFLALFKAEPVAVVHDLHPEYLSTKYALSLPLRAMAIQHHHAHIASVMAERGLEGPVIGVAWDGTGFGTDGAIWGGEFLIADLLGFRRAAHLRYLPLPGASASIRRPWRMALCYLLAAFGKGGMEVAQALMPGLGEREMKVVGIQAKKGINSPLTSSGGRLFEAVSAILGICLENTYEGQAAMELEMEATGAREAKEGLEFGLKRSEGGWVLDPVPAIRALAEAVGPPAAREMEDRASLALGFHRAAAQAIARTCSLLGQETKIRDVALSGGVFQNRLLLGLVAQALEEEGLRVHTNRLVPPNDGGLSLGQAAIAARRLG